MPFRPHLKCLSALTAAAMLAGCSTSFWYTQIQASQYRKCQALTNAEDRRRCQAQTEVDKERYDRERKNDRSPVR